MVKSVRRKGTVGASTSIKVGKSIKGSLVTTKKEAEELKFTVIAICTLDSSSITKNTETESSTGSA